MTESAQGWLVAAACCEERPSATLAAPPRQHLDQLVRVGFIAGTSVAYLIAVAILARPIPSRDFVASATLPAVAAPRSPLLERSSVDAVDAASRSELPAPAARATVALAAVRDPNADPARRAADAPRPERRNPVSRFFRGVWRGVRTQPGKSNSF